MYDCWPRIGDAGCQSRLCAAPRIDHEVIMLPACSVECRSANGAWSPMYSTTSGCSFPSTCLEPQKRWQLWELPRFRRDTLDYTKTKTNVLAVAPCSPGRPVLALSNACEVM